VEFLRRRANRTRARTGERGAALVEGALVAPLFFLLIFAIFEFGLVFRQYLSMSTASRNATRTASTAGNLGQADYLTLQEIKRSTRAIKDSEITYVVVFKAPSPTASIEDDTALQPCLTASQTGICNRYVVSDFSRPTTDFGNCGTGSTSPDRYWCPSTRNVAVSGPPDYVGVYVHTRYQAITGIFGRNYDFGEQTIYRIEPQTR
jgi:Flp pilus assembly protein TadG